MPTLPLPFTAGDFPTVLWVLLGLILLLQAVGVVQRLLLAARLARVERALTDRKPSSNAASESDTESAEVDHGGLFEEYLEEDPERRLLSKKEQFEGFRKWRKTKGLNWSK